jgi:SnoaL-like domain
VTRGIRARRGTDAFTSGGANAAKIIEPSEGARVMAKKIAKKAAKKAGKASASKKPAAKAAPKAAKKPAGKSGASPAYKAVNTGKGPSPLEVGAALVSMFNKGQFKEIEDQFWSPQIVSVEGFGVGMGWHGRKSVEAKNAQWMSTHTIHGGSAEGPFVGSSGFAVRFRMDVEDTATGKREMMDEIGVYTVQNGKIVREEFMYLIAGG